MKPIIDTNQKKGSKRAAKDKKDATNALESYARRNQLSSLLKYSTYSNIILPSK